MIIIKKNLFKHILYAIYRKVYIKLFWQFPYLLPAIKNPHIFGLELTNNCNLECVQCFRKKMNKELGFMDVEVFRKLVDEISTYPIAFLRIIGRGEPSLHPELKQIMEYLKEKHIKVEFCTNGVLFENYSITEILNWNIDLLDISVDGIDKESYNKIRKNGDYDRLKRNITLFYNTRNSFKKSTTKINIRNVIFTNFERNQIEEFRKKWLKISDLVIFNKLTPISNSSLSFEKQTRCRGDIFFSAYIRWDGRIAKCPHQGIYEEEEYIGDLHKEELKQIWSNPQLQVLRLLHYKQDFRSLPACTYCFPTHVPNKNNSKILFPK